MQYSFRYGNISLVGKQVSFINGHPCGEIHYKKPVKIRVNLNRMDQMEKTEDKKKYFVARERAVPEVLLKVVQAKRLLDSGKVTDCTGSSRQDRNQSKLFL